MAQKGRWGRREDNLLLQPEVTDAAIQKYHKLLGARDSIAHRVLAWHAAYPVQSPALHMVLLASPGLIPECTP